ncbi:uncharacterized protein VSU04_006870 [Chlamydotis macqueenii]
MQYLLPLQKRTQTGVSQHKKLKPGAGFISSNLSSRVERGGQDRPTRKIQRLSSLLTRSGVYSGKTGAIPAKKATEMTRFGKAKTVPTHFFASCSERKVLTQWQIHTEVT